MVVGVGVLIEKMFDTICIDETFTESDGVKLVTNTIEAPPFIGQVQIISMSSHSSDWNEESISP